MRPKIKTSCFSNTNLVKKNFYRHLVLKNCVGKICWSWWPLVQNITNESLLSGKYWSEIFLTSRKRVSERLSKKKNFVIPVFMHCAHYKIASALLSQLFKTIIPRMSR